MNVTFGGMGPLQMEKVIEYHLFCCRTWPSDGASYEEQVRLKLAAVVVEEQRQGGLEAWTAASVARKLLRVRTYSTQAKLK